MTLEQLRIFLAVAERQHMTRAAEALNLTQPAVSAAIAALEDRHGLPLFHRIGRHIELTPAGGLLMTEAQAILRRVAEAERALGELRELRRGHLTLAASQTVGNYWLPPIMSAFRRQFPAITLDLVIGNTEQVAVAVKNGAAELGIVEGLVTEAQFEQLALPGDSLLLVAGTQHPWTRLQQGRSYRDVVTSEALRNVDWVSREQGSGTRQVMETVLADLGLDPAKLRLTLELPSNEAVRLAVEANAGLTVMSDLAAEVGIAQGRLVAWPLPEAERAFRLLRHRDYHRSKAAAAFMDLIAERRAGAAAS
ncbi:LysR substrate-binding domain-containing protein [Dongia soli]|uniref:LysR substrate-binding domain-containing protein n=1 Tax=Dongia soli TaxID=600628 RepID=A0ABU5E879_9PROT|nr:LysR substrate-binding domain-containing protein [Dongia soli]MDY0881810.1 LysR substrate-binding domain-containing protein [Dongia soli]